MKRKRAVVSPLLQAVVTPVKPKKLQEITDAVRRGERPKYEELRYAVVAYDVLIYLLKLDTDAQRLVEYFKAAESAPRDYIGPANDPENPETVKWAKAMQNLS